jgi:hypothetical protein
MAAFDWQYVVVGIILLGSILRASPAPVARHASVRERLLNKKRLSIRQPFLWYNMD